MSFQPIKFYVTVTGCELFKSNAVKEHVHKNIEELFKTYGVKVRHKVPRAGGFGGGFGKLWELILFLIDNGEYLKAMFAPLSWSLGRFTSHYNRAVYAERPDIGIHLTIQRSKAYEKYEYSGIGQVLSEFYLLSRQLHSRLENSLSAFDTKIYIELFLSEYKLRFTTQVTPERLSKYKTNVLINQFNKLEHLVLEDSENKEYSFRWSRLGILEKKVFKIRHFKGVWVPDGSVKKYYYLF